MTSSSWTWETRFPFRVALAIFTVTVAIGLFNGFHLSNYPAPRVRA